jgi:hypothetical protein
MNCEYGDEYLFQRFPMRINSEIPDPAICRTRHAYADFWECLVDYEEYAYKCPYIVGLAARHFCMHHDFRDFAIQK